MQKEKRRNEGLERKKFNSINEIMLQVHRLLFDFVAECDVAAKGFRAAPCVLPIPCPDTFCVVTDVLLFILVGVPTVVPALGGLIGIRFTAGIEEKMRRRGENREKKGENREKDEKKGGNKIKKIKEKKGE